MNTFWLKMAGVVVVVLAIVVLVNIFSSSQSESKPETKPKTFYDVVREDDKRLRAEPEFAEPPETRKSQAPTAKRQSAAEQPAEPAKPKFRELSEIEKVDAERLFNTAIQHRKIGRLPTTGFKVMVDCCRQLIEKYPDSVYAFKAKRMLRDMPERFRPRYKITEEEIDLGDLK